MNDTFENVNELNEEKLTEIAGGKKQPVGPGTGIQWDDPRCTECTAWCRDFKYHFKDCTLFSQGEKDRMYYLCDQFCMYLNTEANFNLEMAKSTFCEIAILANMHSLERMAGHKWQIFAMVFQGVIG